MIQTLARYPHSPPGKGKTSNDGVPSTPSGSGSIEVNLDAMSKVPGWLTNVQTYVGQLNASISHLRTQLGIDQSQPKTGTFPPGIRVFNQVVGIDGAVSAQLNSMVTQLGTAVSATNQIIANYKTTEALNAANANDIDSLFTGGGSGASPSGASVSPSGSSYDTGDGKVSN
ncbi:hypothetical protein [Fodinicola feengrottensis]|uniref:hypothetical protein n=1 Tax=Fodinicola feengrottensis TaxID=435914 RepID=UPI0013D569A8|nr:hypothetical protein [Fodinicola feengrottensis]